MFPQPLEPFAIIGERLLGQHLAILMLNVTPQSGRCLHAAVVQVVPMIMLLFLNPFDYTIHIISLAPSADSAEDKS